MEQQTVMTKERTARMNKRISPEQHEAFAKALGMRPEEIDPTDAFGALKTAIIRGQGDVDAAADILLDAGVIVEVRRA